MTGQHVTGQHVTGQHVTGQHVTGQHDPARQLRFTDLGRPLVATTFVALDLETTGLAPGRDRITEIGAVKVCGGEVLGELRTFVHPGIPVPAGITALTGITDAMVRDAPTIGAVLPTVLRFLEGAVFVAHNAPFDVSFLRAACDANDAGDFDPIVVDTARLARRLVRDEVRNCRLATLAAHFRARTQPDHRALHDARATVDVLHGLIERAGTLGATTLEDLRALARSTSDRAYRRRGLVADAPASPGTYRFLDGRGELLYVGKATDLRARLHTYFGQDPRRRIADMVRETTTVTWTPTPTVLEAEIDEIRLIHAHRPRYNRRSSRPEAAVHVALTREPFPRLSIVRRPGATHLHTLGPLPSRSAAATLVEAFETALPLRPCAPRLRASQDHAPCILKELDRCGAPCDGTQSRTSYGRVVQQAATALHDPTAVLAVLRDLMHAAARDGQYERARRLRTALHQTARAVASARRRRQLASPSGFVACRRDGDATEVVAVRAGRLVATARWSERDDDRLLAWIQGHAATDGSDEPTAGATGFDTRDPDRTADVPEAITQELAEELRLIGAWMDRPGVRILHVDGELATTVAGGRQLAAELAEAASVARAVRRDDQRLRATKVRRTGPTRTDADPVTPRPSPGGADHPPTAVEPAGRARDRRG